MFSVLLFSCSKILINYASKTDVMALAAMTSMPPVLLASAASLGSGVCFCSFLAKMLVTGASKTDGVTALAAMISRGRAWQSLSQI